MQEGITHLSFPIICPGMEEEAVFSAGKWGCSRGEALQEHGDSLWVSATGAQVHPQLLLRICHEKRVLIRTVTFQSTFIAQLEQIYLMIYLSSVVSSCYYFCFLTPVLHHDWYCVSQSTMVLDGDGWDCVFHRCQHHHTGQRAHWADRVRLLHQTINTVRVLVNLNSSLL